ncbi:MAG TPA: hypothetical protein VFY23_13265 [Candidatus Limnocylindrales bacterium]|nr:hypothetical protein [Candidatus Limnocylindrales bacterium]
MSPRFAPVLAAALVLAVAACGASAVAPTPPTTGAVTPVTPTPVPTPRPEPTPVPQPTATPIRNGGDVDGWLDGPELTIEVLGDGTVDVLLEDAGAKAWRVIVAGTGDLAGDRLEIVVEAGDVGPGILATEVQDNVVTSTMELSGFTDETMAAGACHRSLEVCVDDSSFAFADDGSGRLRIRLGMPDPGELPLLVTGGTAGWPGEPFILGPWTDTESFPWGEG